MDPPDRPRPLSRRFRSRRYGILAGKPAIVRRAAASYLGKLGPDARPILPQLKPLLLDSDDEVRGETARAVLAIERAFRDD